MGLISLSYGGINSYTTFGIKAKKRSFIMRPEQRKYSTEIPKLDGYVDFGIGGYKEKVLIFDLYFNGDHEAFEAQKDDFLAWLSNENGIAKQLALSDEPGRYYMAKIYDDVDISNINGNILGSVSFECNPPWQYQGTTLLTPDQIIWNNQDILTGTQWYKEFTASGAFRFTNGGTMAVKPKITLIGYIPAGLNLTYGLAQWQYNAILPYDSIIIDCAAETVLRGSDGSTLKPNVDDSKNAFFNLQPGKDEIDITASGLGTWPLNLTVLIDFVPVRGQ